jgi:hypothetical protein
MWTVDPLGGLLLRYEICLLLHDSRRALTVAELVARIEADGFSLGARPNKVVADAIRWEVRRGRVIKLRRGTYLGGLVPRTSEFRMRARLRAARVELSTGVRVRSSYEHPRPNSLICGTEEVTPQPRTDAESDIWVEDERGVEFLDLDALEAAVGEGGGIRYG